MEQKNNQYENFVSDFSTILYGLTNNRRFSDVIFSSNANANPPPAESPITIKLFVSILETISLYNGSTKLKTSL